MHIYKNEIQFKSAKRFFDKEKSGLKNNTVRFLNEEEKDEFLNHIKEIDEIKISLDDLSDYFDRKIRDISIWERNRDFIVIFTW